jgi:very-short-patch-repair endonuclease
MHEADAIIIAIAARQHGIVARWQLENAGVARHIVAYRTRRQQLQRLHRSVYRLAPLAGPCEREMAAVLCSGEAAVASHRTAAVLLTLLPPHASELSVSTDRGHPRPLPGVRVHRVCLPRDERTVAQGVPVTTAARTLLDLAAVATTRELEQALATALRLELTTTARVARVLKRHPRRPGCARLRTLLSLGTAPKFTRSQAEERFLALVQRAQLPAPVANVRVSGYEVDFHWRKHQLVVEIDGLAYHASRRAFVQDRRRDAALLAAGMRVMRFTWADLTEQPEATVVRVAQALVHARPA